MLHEWFPAPLFQKHSKKIRSLNFGLGTILYIQPNELRMSELLSKS